MQEGCIPQTTERLLSIIVYRSSKRLREEGRREMPKTIVLKVSCTKVSSERKHSYPVPSSESRLVCIDVGRIFFHEVVDRQYLYPRAKRRNV